MHHVFAAAQQRQARLLAEKELREKELQQKLVEQQKRAGMYVPLKRANEKHILISIPLSVR